MALKDTFKAGRPAQVILCGAFVFTLAWHSVLQSGNVYANAFTGALFEMLWLPAILLTFILPVASLLFWYSDGWRIRSVFPWIGLGSAALLIFLLLTDS